MIAPTKEKETPIQCAITELNAREIITPIIQSARPIIIKALFIETSNNK